MVGMVVNLPPDEPFDNQIQTAPFQMCHSLDQCQLPENTKSHKPDLEFLYFFTKGNIKQFLLQGMGRVEFSNFSFHFFKEKGLFHVLQ